MERGEKEKLKFPMDFTKCPACGSEQRIVESAMKEEQPFQPANQRTALQVFIIALVDPIGAITRPTVPVMIGHVDACLECGCLYVTHIEKGVGAPQVKGGIPPFPKMPSLS